MTNPILKYGLFAAGGVLLYNALSKGRAATLLNFYPKSVDGIAFRGLSPEITFTLICQNTSNQVINFNSLAGNLYSNGYYIGNLSHFTSHRITGNSEVSIKLTARLAMIGIVQDLVKAFQGGGFTQMVEFKGQANIDKYQVPVTFKYKIG